MPKLRFAATAVLFTATLVSAIAVISHKPKAVAAAQTKAGLPGILAQLDSSSAKFTSAQADMHQELFDAVIKDTTKQLGQIYFQRKNGSTQMGIKMLAEDAPAGSPPAQILEFKSPTLRILETGAGKVNEFSATGKNQALAQTALALGFGGSGHDLEQSWTITDLGPETLKDGAQPVQTEKLDLVAKDDSVRKNYFSHITIWIDPTRNVSLKQVSYAASDGKPTGNTRTVYYSNIQLNKDIVDMGSFAIKCKGKCS
jgi:outer membrane lipoprotein-sorting protein